MYDIAHMWIPLYIFWGHLSIARLRPNRLWTTFSVRASSLISVEPPLLQQRGLQKFSISSICVFLNLCLFLRTEFMSFPSIKIPSLLVIQCWLWDLWHQVYSYLQISPSLPSRSNSSLKALLFKKQNKKKQHILPPFCGSTNDGVSLLTLYRNNRPIDSISLLICFMYCILIPFLIH